MKKKIIIINSKGNIVYTEIKTSLEMQSEVDTAKVMVEINSKIALNSHEVFV